MRILLGLLLAIGVLPASDVPDAREIVRRSARIDEENSKKANDYTMVQRKITRALDDKGNVTSTRSVTRDLTFVEGEPFYRLIARNDQPLSAEEQKREDDRLLKVSSDLQKESESKKQHRMDDREKRRKRARSFLKEVPDAYDFKLLPDEELNGRSVWVVEATPRKDFKPKVSGAWILSKFRGKLWIDKQDYAWAKVDAESINTVRIGLFVARLDKGAHLVVEAARLNDEVWLPKRILVRYDARILFKSKAEEEESLMSEFKKFHTDSRIVSVSEK